MRPGSETGALPGGAVVDFSGKGRADAWILS